MNVKRKNKQTPKWKQENNMSKKEKLSPVLNSLRWSSRNTWNADMFYTAGYNTIIFLLFMGLAIWCLCIIQVLFKNCIFSVLVFKFHIHYQVCLSLPWQPAGKGEERGAPPKFWFSPHPLWALALPTASMCPLNKECSPQQNKRLPISDLNSGV